MDLAEAWHLHLSGPPLPDGPPIVPRATHCHEPPDCVHPESERGSRDVCAAVLAVPGGTGDHTLVDVLICPDDHPLTIWTASLMGVSLGADGIL